MEKWEVMQDKFNFFVESEDNNDELLKAPSKTRETGRYDNMILSGRATTNIKDRQGETLEPSGFDISDFLKSGMVNLEHFTTRKGSSKFWIGSPIEAKIEGDEFFVKAKLWKGQQEAEDLWDTLLVMQANNVDRKLGWSIEGSKKAVDPNNKKRITKAKINHIAVTFSPVGYNTFADIVKGTATNDFIDLAFNEEETKGGTYILQFEKDGKLITVNKDFSINITEKSMDTESMKPLTREDIKKKTINNVNWDIIMKAIRKGEINKDSIPLIINRHLNAK